MTSCHILRQILGYYQKFLRPQDTRVQEHFVQNWTVQNYMKKKYSKSNYMVISRCKEDLATRLTLNGDKIDRKEVNKILCVWLIEEAGD